MPIPSDTPPFGRSALRDLAVAVLRASATDAGASVFGANAQPTGGSEMPILLVQVPHERKQNVAGRSLPRFDTVMALVMVARVQGVSAADAETALDRLVDQVHGAVLGSYDLLQVVQQFVDVETETVLDTKGRAAVGEAKITCMAEIYQPYLPPAGPPLLAIDLDLVGRDQTPLASATVDLPQT